MIDRALPALVGATVLLIGLLALVVLASRATFGGFGPIALLGMLLPVTLAIGFALLVWFRW